MTVPERIFVVDIETTGLTGEPESHIVEVGIVELFKQKHVIPIYHSIVAPYYPISKDWDQSWVFQNTSLTPEQVLTGRSVTKVIMDLHLFLDKQPATSYNYAFDFGRFLDRDPWRICNEPMPCIMEACGAAYGDVLPCNKFSGCPSAQSSYSYLCPDNPAELPGGIEEHRALSDAIMEAHILKAMLARGDYP